MTQKDASGGLDLAKVSEGMTGRMHRIKTHIDDFDVALDGGIPRGHVVLVAGTAGTMKSSLCYSILYGNALKQGLKGLYITLEQNRPSLLDHMEGLGMDYSKVEDRVNIWDLGLIRSSLITGETWMNILKKDIKEYKEKSGLDILVLDSLPVLDIIAKFDDPRSELFQFFEWLRDLDITTFLISEMSEGISTYAKHEEDFLADGILHVRMCQMDDVNIMRQIRCVKMRSANHTMNYFTLLFEGKRFQVTKVISKQNA